MFVYNISMHIIRLLLTVFVYIIIALPSHAIKIGLLDGVSQAYIGTSTVAEIIDVKTGQKIYEIPAMRSFKFKAKKNKLTIEINDKDYSLGSNWVSISPSDDGFCSVKQRWYRGEFVLKIVNGNLVVINNLSLEDYLRGVVPSEMPSKWNIEAHKAQAIAARSYAIANLGKRAARGYDLKDTPEDQAYGGATSETARTNKACLDTYGIVITYDKKVIPAYYSASAGGHTINSGDAWVKNLPYIHAVPSFDGNVKKNGHGVGMSQHGANNLAAKGYNAYQILTYFYNNVKFGKLDPSFLI